MDVATSREVKPGNRKSYKLDIVWFNVIGFAIIHLVTVYGWYMVATGQVKLATVIWMLAVTYYSSMSTTMGAHRLFTHKCFKANLIVRTILLIGHTVAGQNCLWVWVRDHRQHHKYSDTDADPHNASRGFFFSHIGWLMVRKQPEVIEKGKLIDMSDMNADPIVMFQKKYYKTMFTIFSISIPTLVPYYFWNEDLLTAFIVCFVTRLMTSLNLTWLVNSAAHIYGTRPFTKDLLPTENWVVSLISSGEGWHNYHHSFPWDYKAAELGQHLNFTTTVIEFCEKHGWVWDLKSASPEMVRHRIIKRGDGTHYTFGRRNYNEDDNNNDYKNEDDDYDSLKREAEARFCDDKNSKNDSNNNEMKFIKKDKIDKEHDAKMRTLASIYKLVE